MFHPQASPLAPLLRKLEYSGPLDDSDKEAVLALPHVLKTVEPHAYIVREGDKPTHSCLLRTGFVYRHKIVADGARQICAIHMAGDMVDLQNSLLGFADHNVQALTRAEVAFIPRDAIKRIAFERPAVGAAMWFDTLVDGSIFREWITNVGRRPKAACTPALRVRPAVRGRRSGES
jgi:CRP-like cAMP-binding protein